MKILFNSRPKLFSTEQFNRLVERIKGWEGYSPNCYEDPPENEDGRYSIGYGTKASFKQICDKTIIISMDEAEQALKDYLKTNTLKEYGIIEKKYPFLINEVRRETLCDMLYNLGWNRFHEFKRMCKMLYDNVDDDWHFIAAEARDSKWYRKQCQKRAERIAYELDTGLAFQLSGISG